MASPPILISIQMRPPYQRPITVADLVFQSTHPRGVRPPGCCQFAESSRVSIHAPARGATLPTTTKGYRRSFQSTHPRGVRLINLVEVLTNVVFQSTHPRGVRPSQRRTPTQEREVSIHAPARGATHKTPMSVACETFQSTHPRGVRP